MSAKVFIPEPCSENWTNMSQVEKGRHCEVCEKKVVDFTQDSKDDIVKFLSSNTGGTCGRFRTDQLDQAHISKVDRTGTLWMKIGTLAASLAALLSFKSNTIQGGTTLEFGVNSGFDKYFLHTSRNTKEHPIKINVLDIDGRGIGNASVFISSEDVIISNGKTDIKGWLELILPPQSILSQKIKLDVHASGFKSRTIEDLQIPIERSKVEVRLNNKSGSVLDHFMLGNVVGEAEMEQPVKVITELLGDTVAFPDIPNKVFFSAVEIEELPTVGRVIMMGAPRMEEFIEIPEVVFSEELFLEPIEDSLNTIDPINKDLLDLEHRQIDALTIELQELNRSDKRGSDNEPENNKPLDHNNKALEPEVSKFDLYPNPTSDIVNILLSKKMIFSFQVFSANGKIIEEGTMNNDRFQLSMNDRANGTYIVKIISQNKFISSKIFVVNK